MDNGMLNKDFLFKNAFFSMALWSAILADHQNPVLFVAPKNRIAIDFDRPVLPQMINIVPVAISARSTFLILRELHSAALNFYEPVNQRVNPRLQIAASAVV
jgi:hypothetical protein